MNARSRSGIGFGGRGLCSDASGYLVDQSSVDVMKGGDDKGFGIVIFSKLLIGVYCDAFICLKMV